MNLEGRIFLEHTARCRRCIIDVESKDPSAATCLYLPRSTHSRRDALQPLRGSALLACALAFCVLCAACTAPRALRPPKLEAHGSADDYGGGVKVGKVAIIAPASTEESEAKAMRAALVSHIEKSFPRLDAKLAPTKVDLVYRTHHTPAAERRGGGKGRSSKRWRHVARVAHRRDPRHAAPRSKASACTRTSRWGRKIETASSI